MDVKGKSGLGSGNSYLLSTFATADADVKSLWPPNPWFSGLARPTVQHSPASSFLAPALFPLGEQRGPREATWPRVRSGEADRIGYSPFPRTAHDLSLGLEYRSQRAGLTSLSGRQVSVVLSPPHTPRSSRAPEKQDAAGGWTRSSSPEGSAFQTAAGVFWCSHCHVGTAQWCSHSLPHPPPLPLKPRWCQILRHFLGPLTEA